MAQKLHGTFSNNIFPVYTLSGRPVEILEYTWEYVQSCRSFVCGMKYSEYAM